jgi:hypothetical protein
MPPVTSQAGDIWQVLIQGRIENQECENVLWFRSQGADTDVILHLLTQVMQCFVTTLLPVLASSYEFERVVGRKMIPDLGSDYEVKQDAGETVTGQAAGDAEPSFVSALISLRSVRGGRSGKGRMFIAGVPESGTLKSYIPTEGAFYAGLVAFVGCMMEHFLTTDVLVNGHWEWGVFSRKLGNAKAPFLAAGFSPMVDAVVKSQLATTRSRKIGHGR